MTEQLKQAAQQAIEVLQHYIHGGSEYRKPAEAAIDGLTRALTTSQPAAQATPEPAQLDVARQAIEERDAMESSYHALAQSMVYEGNSVSWWYGKAKAYRNAIDEVWSALKAAGIRADGTKTCADGVRELAATPPQQAAGEPVGEPFVATYSSESIGGRQHDTGRVNKGPRGGFFASTASPEDARLIADALNAYTHPAPGVPEGWAIERRPDLSPTALVVRSPKDGPGFLTLENNHSNSAYRMLYRLASDVLAAAQAKGGV